MPSEYLEKERGVNLYLETFKNSSEEIIKKYGTVSIKNIEDALNKQLEVIKEQEELFLLPKELQEEDLQATIQKTIQDQTLSEAQKTEKIDSVHFDHANRFRKPVLSMVNLEGIFYMLQDGLEEEKNASISDIKVEPELDSVLKNVDPDLKRWILDSIKNASQAMPLSTPEITLFLKNKISKKMVKENPDKGDVLQLKNEFENFLIESILENTEEKNSELKYKSLSNEQYDNILKYIDPTFAKEIRAAVEPFDGQLDLEKTLPGLVQNLQAFFPNLKNLEDPEDSQVAHVILRSTLEDLKPSKKLKSEKQ